MSFKGSENYRRYTTGRTKEEVFEGRSQHVLNAEFTGVKNGVNRLYTFTEPYYLGSLQVFFAGMIQRNVTDYVESDDLMSVTLNFAPYSDESLVFNYRKL